MKTKQIKKSKILQKTKKQKTFFHKLSSLKNKYFVLIIFIAIFGLIGVKLLVPSSASIPSPVVSGADRYGMASGELNWLSRAEVDARLDAYKASGAKWVRFDVHWSQIQYNGATSYNWTPVDQVVESAKARDMKVLGMIGYTPPWARPSTCTNDDKCAPANPNTYAHFVSEVVERYSPQGLHYWEIWNEPNLINFWKPVPNASQYSALLKAGYSAAKQADPSAVVLGGSMSPAEDNGTNISPITFLKGMYTNGAGPYYDALSHHPYCYYPGYNCPTQYADWSAWSQMHQTNPSLRSIMTDNGDSWKKIWATEFGAPTNGTNAITEAAQAQMVTDAYNAFASYDWSGPIFWYTYRDYGTNTTDREQWFGLLRYDGSKKPAHQAYLDSATAAASTSPTTSPSATLTFSGVSSGQVLSGGAKIQANPENATNITKVDFYLDGAYLRTEAGAPYCLAGDDGTNCLNFNTTQWSNAQHTLRAVMTHNGGANIAEASVTFSVQNGTTPAPTEDTTAPTVTISSPANGVKVSNKQLINASAQDNVGVTKMELYIDNKLIITLNGGSLSYTWKTSPVKKGTHSIVVTAYDAKGNKATATVSVYK